MDFPERRGGRVVVVATRGGARGRVTMSADAVPGSMGMTVVGGRSMLRVGFAVCGVWTCCSLSEAVERVLVGVSGLVVCLSFLMVALAATVVVGIVWCWWGLG